MQPPTSSYTLTRRFRRLPAVCRAILPILCLYYALCVTCRVHVCAAAQIDRFTGAWIEAHPARWQVLRCLNALRLRRASDHACESKTRTAVLLLPSSPLRSPSRVQATSRECELYISSLRSQLTPMDCWCVGLKNRVPTRPCKPCEPQVSQRYARATNAFRLTLAPTLRSRGINACTARRASGRRWRAAGSSSARLRCERATGESRSPQICPSVPMRVISERTVGPSKNCYLEVCVTPLS